MAALAWVIGFLMGIAVGLGIKFIAVIALIATIAVAIMDIRRR